MEVVLIGGFLLWVFLSDVLKKNNENAILISGLFTLICFFIWSVFKYSFKIPVLIIAFILLWLKYGKKNRSKDDENGTW